MNTDIVTKHESYAVAEIMFEEQIDKTIVEAKGEIDSFITNAVTQTGLETLRKEGKMLDSL